MAALTLLGTQGAARAQDAAPAVTPAPTAPAPAKLTGNEVRKKPSSASQLDTVVVTDSAITPYEAAAHDLANVAGGASLINADDFTRGSTANVAQVLKYQPGVLAQSNNGGESTRLSIRGSGIMRAAQSFEQGIVLEQNGLSLRTSSGFPYESLEPLAISRVEVLRGDNAFDYAGPVALGGVINYVQKTGYDSSPFQSRFEAGGDGYFKEQVSSGLVEGPLDYYVSGTRFDYDGFRNGSHANSSRGILNVGYQINPDVKTSLFLSASKQDQENPGSLTWSQVQNARQISQYPEIRNRENPGTLNLGSVTTVKIDEDSSLEFGAIYLENPNNNPGGPSPSAFDFFAVNGSVRYKREDLLFGLNSTTRFSVLTNNQLFADQINQNLAGVTLDKTKYQANDQILVLSNELEVYKNLWLTTGIAGLFQHRGSDAEYPLHKSITKDYTDAAPRFGLRYEVTPDWQVFTSYGRAVEAPYSSGYQVSNSASVPTSLLNLNKQISDTIDVGARGTVDRFQWDLTFYHSWVQNELLTVQVQSLPTAVYATSNATDTTHQGIEAQFNTLLWNDLDTTTWKGDPQGKAQRLTLQQTYTWNHFQYVNDPVYGHNSLPGVPEHIYQAELLYEHPSGFYVGSDVEAVLNKYAVDFTNSFYSHPYSIFGAKIGWRQPGKGWEVFAELDNIADKRYAAIVSPTRDAGGVDAAVFTPGEGRNITAGVSYSF